MKHAANPKRQYCANVVLKVNAKLGGANVYLPPRHMPFVSERPTVPSFPDLANRRLLWALMSIILHRETPFVHPSARSSPAWTLAPVDIPRHSGHKVLELRSSPISKL